MSNMKKNRNFSLIVLNCLMVVLTCTGFLHIYRKRAINKIFRILSVIYSLLVLCLVTLHIVLLLVGISLPPSPLLNDSYVGVLTMTIFVSGYLYGFSILLSSFLQCFKREGYHFLTEKIESMSREIKSPCNMIISICGIFHLGVILSIGTNMSVYTTDQMKDVSFNLEYHHSYAPADLKPYGYFVTFLSIFHGFWINVVVITLILYFIEIIIILVSNQFKVCTERITKLETRNINEMENIISDYEMLRGFLDQIEKLLSITIGVMVTVEVVYVCIMGYLIVIFKFHSWAIQQFGTLVIAEVIQLFLMCACAAYLNTCAHRFVDALYKKIWFSGKLYKEQQRILMFMTNALHSPVGLTYFGLFTLNKEALLSVFGTLLAYFIIVIQFAQQVSLDITSGNYTMYNTSISINSMWIDS